MRKNLKKLAVATTLIALALSGCSSEPPKTDTLVWSIEGANLSNGHLDPHRSQLDVSSYVARNFLDSLVAIDQSGKVYPWLAESWSVSPDGLNYSFKLRTDVTFHDGEKLNAEAVKANFDHIQDPLTESAQALSMLGGDSFIGAEVVSENEIQLKLAQPFSPLLANLSTAFIGIYSPKVIAEKGQELRAGGPGVSVGSGPFILSDYTPNQELVFSRNPEYNWAPEFVQLPAQGASKLVVRIIPEQSTVVGAFNSGEIQIASKLTPMSAGQLTDQATVQNSSVPGVPYSLYVNQKNGIFAEQKLRAAFRAALDIPAAVDTVFGKLIKPAVSILSSGSGDNYAKDLEFEQNFNLDTAKQLLDESGWTELDAEGYRVKNGKRLSALWVSYTPVSDDHRNLGQIFVQQLKEVGFELDWQILEPAQYMEHYGAGTFDLTDWSFASLDADILRNHLHSSGYQNASYVNDSELDRILTEAAASSDAQKRVELYHQVQRWNQDQVAIVPVYEPSFITGISSSVKTIQFDANGWPLLQTAQLD